MVINSLLPFPAITCLLESHFLSSGKSMTCIFTKPCLLQGPRGFYESSEMICAIVEEKFTIGLHRNPLSESVVSSITGTYEVR